VYITAFPGGRGEVHISLDVIDRILAEVLRGFGAVPKRGAEVGGILLGSCVADPDPTARILDFVLTPIEYRRGPSFLLSEKDLDTFARLVQEARAHPQFKPVGFFRSHTRDAPGITGEDRALFSRFFPAEDDLFLLVRPYATRVSTAGFVARTKGELPSVPASEFPFRGSALDPSSARDHATRGEGRRLRRDLPIPEPPPLKIDPPPPKEEPAAAAVQRPRSISEAAAPLKRPEPPAPSLPPLPPRPVTAWTPEFLIDAGEDETRHWSVWTWLVLILITVGLPAGYFVHRYFPLPWISSASAYRLTVTAKTRGSDIQIEWDRTSPLVSQTRSATLVILDGDTTKTVDLSPDELHTGNTVYEPSSNEVRIELRLQLPGDATVTSNTTWRR
jgi:hypothetical protein